MRIEWQFPRGTGPAINEAIANGQADFANYGGLPNIVGRGAGLKTKVVASYGTNPSYVVAGGDIRAIADLRGKKISVSKGTINELALNRVLALGGLSEKDVSIYDLQAADQVSAITGGSIDAVLGGSNLLPLVDKGVAREIFTTKGHPGPGSLFGSFVVTEDFAKRYPETTARVVKVFIEAAHFASLPESKDAVYDIWALTGVPRASIEADFQGDDIKDRLSPLLDPLYVGNIENGVKFALDNKLIRNGFDVKTWIDPSYLQAALQQLKLETFWIARDTNGAPKS